MSHIFHISVFPSKFFVWQVCSSILSDSASDKVTLTYSQILIEKLFDCCCKIFIYFKFCVFLMCRQSTDSSHFFTGVLMAWSQHKLTFTPKPFSEGWWATDSAPLQQVVTDRKWLWKEDWALFFITWPCYDETKFCTWSGSFTVLCCHANSANIFVCVCLDVL